MVYLFGTVGFIGGFAVGLMLLHFLLRNKTRKELLEDDSLKWKYGLLNWGMAILFCYIFIKIYEEYERIGM